MKKLVLFLTLFISATSYAQQYRPQNSVTIYEQLNKLANLNTVMYIAAHPDDENTRLLSYLVHHEHFRTIYLSLTRGDGGQNLIGTELGLGLGLIRNYELLEARKIDGAEQIFANVLDFGYSKNDQETFLQWNKQSLIDDVKRAIQIYKPSVLICRFPTTGEGGHGQHTASAIATVEAYRQLQEESKYNRNIHLPIRVVFNAFQFGNRSTIKPEQIKLITNQYNPLLGESYGEMAGRSRSIHRSQGVGTPQNIGLNYEHFELMAGTPMDSSIFEGMMNVWQRNNLTPYENILRNIIKKYSFTQPHLSISELVLFKKQINTAKLYTADSIEVNQLLDRLILSCAGLTIEVLGTKELVTRGEKLPITTRIIARSNNNSPISVEFIKINNKFIQQYSNRLAHDTVFQVIDTITVSKDISYDQPYWLHTAPIQNRFVIDDKDFSLPQSKPQLTADILIKIEDEPFHIEVPISHKVLDPLRGDVISQVMVVPPAVIRPSKDKVFYQHQQDSIAMDLTIEAFQDIPEAYIVATFIPEEIAEVAYGEHTTAAPSSRNKVILSKKIFNLPSNKKRIESVKLPAMGNGSISFSINTPSESIALSQSVIKYDHLPKLIYYEPATTQLIKKEFIIPNGKYGFVQGAGDLVFESLKNIGLDIHLIPNEQLQNQAYLKQFKSIIVGVRAYNTNETLAAYNHILLDYVAQGGKVVVQYNTNNNLLIKDFAPYPLTISRDRVTMEDAPVTMLNPDDAMLKHPNSITQQDFTHWVQERGLYFPAPIDAAYKKMLAMNDPLEGEHSLENAIIYAEYGKGTYVYTSLSFFRQIPAAHIGATKLFLNLIQ